MAIVINQMIITIKRMMITAAEKVIMIHRHNHHDHRPNGHRHHAHDHHGHNHHDRCATQTPWPAFVRLFLGRGTERSSGAHDDDDHFNE